MLPKPVSASSNVFARGTLPVWGVAGCLLVGGWCCGGAESTRSSVSESGSASGGYVDARPADVAVFDSIQVLEIGRPDVRVDWPADGSAGDGAARLDGAAGAVADATSEVLVEPPSCNPDLRWGGAPNEPVELQTPPGADDILGSLTPDELSITWVRKVEGRFTVWHSDRDDVSSSFRDIHSVTAVGYESSPQATLSTNGMRLVLVRSDGQGFGELRRVSRRDTFAGVPDEQPFADLAKLAPGEVLADPVLAADDSTMFYSRIGSSTAPTLLVSTRSAKESAWLPGVTLESSRFAPIGNKLRRPSGVSLDRRSLFYFDESTEKAEVAFRPAVGEPFNRFVEVGSRRSMVPTSSCLRLYFSASTVNGLRIFSMVSG